MSVRLLRPHGDSVHQGKLCHHWTLCMEKKRGIRLTFPLQDGTTSDIFRFKGGLPASDELLALATKICFQAELKRRC